MKITELSTAQFNEEDPWVSADGRTMMFVTNKDGLQQIYQVTR
jgi:Tol biopolymer transport system component